MKVHMKSLISCLAVMLVTVAETGLSQSTNRVSPFPATGLAARYRGDVGLENDPRVIFTENFEHKSVESLAARWETATDRESMSFSVEVPSGSSGEPTAAASETSATRVRAIFRATWLLLSHVCDGPQRGYSSET